MTIQRWKNRPFTIRPIVSILSGLIYDESGEPIPDATIPAGCIPPDLDDSGEVVAELVIDCQSSGYYDGGRTWGLPEDCYPPEGEDDRKVVSVEIVIDGKAYEITGRKSLDSIAEHYRDEIEESEVCHDCDD